MIEDPPEPLTDEEVDEIEAGVIDDELDASGYFECSCGSTAGLWPLFSFAELRDPDCPIHGRSH